MSSPAPVVPPRGEEFRDDLRGTALNRAVRQDVRRALPARTLAELTRLDPRRSTLAVLQTLGACTLVLGVACSCSRTILPTIGCMTRAG
jgi:hypothetical protein